MSGFPETWITCWISCWSWWSHFMLTFSVVFFNVLSFRCLGECLNVVCCETPERFFGAYKTWPKFASQWGWVDKFHGVFSFLGELMRCCFCVVPNTWLLRWKHCICIFCAVKTILPRSVLSSWQWYSTSGSVCEWEAVEGSYLCCCTEGLLVNTCELKSSPTEMLRMFIGFIICLLMYLLLQINNIEVNNHITTQDASLSFVKLCFDKCRVVFKL